MRFASTAWLAAPALALAGCGDKSAADGVEPSVGNLEALAANAAAPSDAEIEGNGAELETGRNGAAAPQGGEVPADRP